jgi:2-dehydropantoate 2-reductase
MRILILGAGAVGGYIGARLLSAGADVFFVARGQRLKSLAENGLAVTSPLGNFTGPVKFANAPPAGFTPHVAIIACRAPALDDALKVIAPHIGRETRLLPILNGVAHLEMLQQRFPEAPVLGGLTHGALTLRDDGVVKHLTPFFSMVAGPTAQPADTIAEQFVDLLGKAGIDARLSSDILRDIWAKFVFLATLAGSTCLMRTSIGTILASDDGEGLILELLAETLAVARAEGFAPDAASMTQYKRSLTERGSTLTSSMLRDILAGRHTEADHILGDMLRRAQQHNLATPILRIAHAHLQCYEAALP